jgi:hypothetical protein
MSFRNIILCTDAPDGQGLAHYYYRAFCDVVGEESVSILNDGNRDYGASLADRIARRAQLAMPGYSRRKCDEIIESLKGGRNLIILFNNAELETIDIKRLASVQGVYLVNYLSDHPYAIVPSRRKEVLRSIPEFHMVCTFAQDLVPVLYSLGARRAGRIPFGYCRYTHLEPAANVSVEFPEKVVYFGTWSPEIEPWVNQLTSFDFEIDGNGWAHASAPMLRDLAARKKPRTDKNMAIAARKAGVVVNFTRSPHGCFHTMKTFELPAAGACIVSNFSREQDEFFRDKESMTYFNTSSEMIENVRYLLDHPAENERLRAQALTAAVKHSYHERCKQLLALLNKEHLWS